MWYPSFANVFKCPLSLLSSFLFHHRRLHLRRRILLVGTNPVSCKSKRPYPAYPRSNPWVLSHSSSISPCVFQILPSFCPLLDHRVLRGLFPRFPLIILLGPGNFLCCNGKIVPDFCTVNLFKPHCVLACSSLLLAHICCRYSLPVPTNFGSFSFYSCAQETPALDQPA